MLLPVELALVGILRLRSKMILQGETDPSEDDQQADH